MADNESDIEIILENDNSELIEPVNKNPLYRTTFCKNFEKEGKCERPNCDFYHSIEERRIPICIYKDNCKSKICKFCHPWENEIEWLKRTGIKYPNNIPEKVDRILIDNNDRVYKYTPPLKPEIIIKSDKDMAGIYSILALEKGHKIIRLFIL